jgi:proline dehydrogenase
MALLRVSQGYKFGCKLVRGAYMELERQRAHALDMPSPIWDTIEQTHTAYDQAVAAMLPLVRDEGAEMMVASHNQRSIEAAVAGMEKEGLPPSSPVSFGQLLGMADHLTFLLGRNGFRAYKYVTYGEVELVMPYLIRRAQENSSVLGGTAVEEKLMRKELRRRILG